MDLIGHFFSQIVNPFLMVTNQLFNRRPVQTLLNPLAGKSYIPYILQEPRLR